MDDETGLPATPSVERDGDRVRDGDSDGQRAGQSPQGQASGAGSGEASEAQGTGEGHMDGAQSAPVATAEDAAELARQVRAGSADSGFATGLVEMAVLVQAASAEDARHAEAAAEAQR